MNNKNQRLIVMGDRVLISPDEGEERTDVGLYLPKWAVEKEAIQGGTIVATGPGTPLPDPQDIDDEPWKSSQSEPSFIPMQAEEGDYAIFLRKASVEIRWKEKKYLVVPQAAILILLRDEFDFDELNGVEDQEDDEFNQSHPDDVF